MPPLSTSVRACSAADVCGMRNSSQRWAGIRGPEPARARPRDASTRRPRERHAGHARHEPGHPVPEAPADGFLERVPGARAGREEAAEARDVLVVLVEERLEEPLRRDDADETSLIIDDGQRALSARDGLPCGDFLIRAGRDQRGGAVHEPGQRLLGWHRQQVLETNDTDEAFSLADDHEGDAVEPSGRQRVAHGAGQVRRPGNWHVARGETLGGLVRRPLCGRGEGLDAQGSGGRHH